MISYIYSLYLRGELCKLRNKMGNKRIQWAFQDKTKIQNELKYFIKNNKEQQPKNRTKLL